MSKPILLLCAVTTISGCWSTASAPPSDAERAAIADTIDSLAEELFDAARTLDPEGIFAHLSPDSQIYIAVDGQLITNRAEFETVVRTDYGGLRSQSFEFTRNETVVLGRDVAITWTLGPLSTMDTLGVATAPRSLAATLVWHREEDGFKLVAVHESLPDPLAAAVTP